MSIIQFKSKLCTLNCLVIISIYSPEEKKWNGAEKKREKRKKKQQQRKIKIFSLYLALGIIYLIVSADAYIMSILPFSLLKDT